MDKAKIVMSVFVASMVLAVLVGALSAQVGNPGITMKVTPMEDEVGPGETATYNVSVTSISNEREYVNFTIDDLTSGWSYTFAIKGFDLGPGATNCSTLSIEVPTNATPGNYYHNVTALAWMDDMPFPVEETSYNDLKTTVVAPRVLTYAKVIETEQPPNVQYKWEKPDDTPGDGYTNVYPVPGDIVTVDKYVVVCDPNGKEDIRNVTVRTFYPLENGSACNCVPCNRSNCCEPPERGIPIPDGECVLKEWSIAEPLQDIEACKAAKLDAYKKGLLTLEQVEEIDEFIENGTGWIYVEHNSFTCSDPAGNYTVCAQVFDYNGSYDCMANTFEYLSIVSLRIDFDKINYGEVTPSITKWVYGDDDLTTPKKPTIKNEGNDPMDVRIESWNMTRSGGGGVIQADKLDARINNTEQWLALPPGVLFDIGLQGCTPTPINFSLHAPAGTPAGDYFGYVRLTGLHG